MAEIRLICPDCGTEYQIPEIAVPDGGRDVECSECGRVWHAAPPAAAVRPMEMGVYSYNFAEFKGLSTPDATPPTDAETASTPVPEHEAQSETVTTSQPIPAAAASSVPLKRRLPENVLNILLEEVEHERQARLAESNREAEQEPDPVTAQAVYALEEPDWPATTVIGKRRQTPEVPVAKVAPPVGAPESAQKAVQTSAHEAEAKAESVVTAAKPMNTLPVLAASQPKNDYWQGIGTAAAIAAILLAIYVIAPSGAPDGMLGDIRHGLDQARLWLQNAANGPQS
ncbi:zinc-ribbon domain-containing protein [Paracoccus sp. 11-3]|uniref:Zinc-ribbon domain-containing protein n=1 Tax=Paracoccus amoyensis TaxID=2760093 RepID=A0A926GQ03_9RHOB|nr:zinc-ribbon domain-containing protein [Paracoccus amoyensis]MBC9247850.1 zinc-ribbon domain-containing protein [Paracoccus amoyensis]